MTTTLIIELVSISVFSIAFGYYLANSKLKPLRKAIVALGGSALFAIVLHVIIDYTGIH